MKKIILVSIILAVAVIGVLLVWMGGKIAGDVKHFCEAGFDCVLSERDPDGFGTCVNKNWNEEWKKSPESKKFIWECLYAGEEICGCINNKCQRTDSEPGC